MRIEHFKPCSQLRPAVERYWSWQSEPGELVRLPTLLPGTGAELFFHLHEPLHCAGQDAAGAPLPAAHLLCVRSAPLALRHVGRFGFIAIRFRAGMLHRFTSVPGADLMDRAWPAGELWGRAGAALARQVQDAGGNEERVRLIERFLLRQMTTEPDRLVEHAIDALYRSAPPVAQLAQAGGIGVRQFERRFRAVTGQAPAEVRRIARVQKTVRALLLDPARSPLDAALAQGYFDQSHFIRDFRTLAGAAPGRFIAAARASAHFYNPPSGDLARNPVGSRAHLPTPVLLAAAPKGA